MHGDYIFLEFLLLAQFFKKAASCSECIYFLVMRTTVYVTFLIDNYILRNMRYAFTTNISFFKLFLRNLQYHTQQTNEYTVYYIN